MALRAFLEDVAREAGGVALGFFGKVETEHKGTSIVSEADRAAERLILSRIKAEFPGEYILAEESGASGDDPIGDDCAAEGVVLGILSGGPIMIEPVDSV